MQETIRYPYELGSGGKKKRNSRLGVQRKGGQGKAIIKRKELFEALKQKRKDVPDTLNGEKTTQEGRTRQKNNGGLYL